ncbi:MAG: GWxTD domain-containing protein [Vicinamibacteria bacterium]
MIQRHTLAAALALAALAPALHADKLDKQDKKWLEEEVAAIILPAEAKVFRDLKKDDRPEFQKIFWARRDTDPETAKPENEFKTWYLARKAEADTQFRAGGRLGSVTDCGRVFILLGPADSRKTEQGAPVLGGSRQPEIWTYREKPELPFKFKDSEIQIAFDEQCELPPSARFKEQLDRVAEGKITRPNIDFRFGKDGRLTKLVDLLPKPSPAQALLKTPREDFPLAAQSHFLKVQDGGTALVGIVSGKADGLTVKEAGGKKTARVVVCAQAAGADGRQAAFYEQPTTVELGADGTFAASYRLGLKPGKYTIRAGAIDETTQKGSIAAFESDVPDFNAGEITAASIIIIKDIEENAVNDPAHPWGAYLLGAARLVPLPGHVFAQADSLSFFYQYYDAKVDETSGAANVTGSLKIMSKGRVVAQTQDQPFDKPIGGTIIGPVPLAKYEPGSYVVTLKLKDVAAGKEITRETTFDIK